MITPQHARAMILAAVSATGSEDVALADALGQVLATDVLAPGMLPAFDHAAMDGFALKAADTLPAPTTLPVVATMPAGADAVRPLGTREAVRIMTGAMLPPGTDAVIPFEQVVEDDSTVTMIAPVPPGANVRHAGEDVRQGRMVLKAGEELTPARLALLAALGIGTVAVHRRPRVAILTTGDELVPPGQPLAPGQIHDCNTTALITLVREAGGVPVLIGRAGDDRPMTRRLLQGAGQTDLILTTGGISKGDYDYVADVAAELGEILFAEVAQQPGKPLTFARLGRTPLIALPGTPVAVLVTFEYYVRPALRKLQGLTNLHRPLVSVTLTDGVRLHPQRQQFLRAVVHHAATGYVAQLVEGPGDKHLSAYAMANALLSIPPGNGRLEPGQRAVALLLQPEEVLARAAMRPLDNEPDPAPAAAR